MNFNHFNNEVLVKIYPDFNTNNMIHEFILVLEKESNYASMEINVLQNNFIHLKFEDSEAKEKLLKNSPIKWKDYILTIQSFVGDSTQKPLVKEKSDMKRMTRVKKNQRECLDSNENNDSYQRSTITSQNMYSKEYKMRSRIETENQNTAKNVSHAKSIFNATNEFEFNSESRNSNSDEYSAMKFGRETWKNDSNKKLLDGRNSDNDLMRLDSPSVKNHSPSANKFRIRTRSSTGDKNVHLELPSQTVTKVAEQANDKIGYLLQETFQEISVKQAVRSRFNYDQTNDNIRYPFKVSNEAQKYEAVDSDVRNLWQFPQSNSNYSVNKPALSSNQLRTRARSCSHRRGETTEDDGESISFEFEESSDENESHVSSNSKILNFKDKRNRFLLFTYQADSNPTEQELEHFLRTNKNDINKMFKEKTKFLTRKRQEVFDRLLTRQYEDSNSNEIKINLKIEEQLLLGYMESYNKELERLANINTNRNTSLKDLKHAYEREFNRAKKSLPFYAYRSKFIECINDNDIILLLGDTGSGKTTQVPQYLLEYGFAGQRKIVCTQPRNIAAVSVSERIASEMKLKNSGLIISKNFDNFARKKFNEKSPDEKRSKLVFMTDKKLLSEYRRNKNLMKYSCVIIDEAHERTLFTDVLMAELKKLVIERRQNGHPLKLIIMSATLDENKFSNYFNNCPVIRVPGQMYPVKTYFEKSNVTDYFEKTIEKVKSLISSEYKNTTGDVLIFLPSIEDIKNSARKIKRFIENKKLDNKYEILQLHGRLDAYEQAKVFKEYPDKIKIIFSTNVAETSVTINGVQTIIDSGRVKERIYDQARNISILKLKLISQSSATQRRGRAGRCAPGNCYRIYTSDDYENSMEPMLRPEIMKMHLGIVVLQLMACGIHKIPDYDLIDMPDAKALKKAIQKLETLQLINNNTLTEYGRIAAEMYLEPSISRMIIEALELKVADFVIKIAAMMTVSNILYKNSISDEEKNVRKLNNSCSKGDLITLLEIYNTYEQVPKKEKQKWCDMNQYSFNALNIASSTYRELFAIIKRSKFKISKNLIKEKSVMSSELENDLENRILRSICAGFHSNLAFFDGKINGNYVFRLVDLNQQALVSIDSVLYLLNENEFDNKFLLFTDLMRNQKLYMKNLTPIKLEMLSEYSKKDFTDIKSNVKEIISFKLEPKLIEAMKGKNCESFESLEESLGTIVFIKNNILETSVPSLNVEKSKKTIKKYILNTKQLLENEIYEYKPNSNTQNIRVIIGKGLKVHTILFESEFIRLNFIDLNIQDNSIENLFSRYGNLLNVVKHNDNLKSSGYVIYSKSEDAKRAYNELHNKITLNPSIVTNEKQVLGNKTLKAFWYLSEPTGKAILNLEDGTNLEETLKKLNTYGYAGKIDKVKNKIIVSDVLKYDNLMDEIIFKKLISGVKNIQNCYFIREESSVNEDIDLMLESCKIKSLFEKFGTIKDVDIIPCGVNKDGNLKPQTTVVVNYESCDSVIAAVRELDYKRIPNELKGFGYMHLHTNFLHEYKLPNKAVILFNIKELKLILEEQFQSSIIHKEKCDKFDNDIIIVKSKNPNLLDNAIKFMNYYLKPITISLPYYEYDCLRKALNKNRSQQQIENQYQVYLAKDARVNQINIYGKLKNKCEEAKNELLNYIDNSNEQSIKIKLHSLKVILENNGEIYKKLCEEFRGEINLDFKQKQIKFVSKQSQLESFKKRIEELNDKYAKKNPKLKINSTGNECGICMDEITNCYELTLCSHKFCLDCLKSQFDAFSLGNKLNCVTCEMYICLVDLKTFTDYENFNNKCSISLSNFMTNNSLFKYCSGGCNTIIKKSIKNNDNLYCESCLKEVKIRLADLQFQQYLNNSQLTKKCPGCKNPIEKDIGCNHVICISCKTHFCWKCLFSGSNSAVIYDHLRQTHGGIFDVPN